MCFSRKIFRLILIFSLFFSSGNLNAFVYDDDILDIFSKTLPRFILMSSQKERLEENLAICLLHDKVDERAAFSLTEKINSHYPNGIKEYKIKVISSSYSDMESCAQSQLVYMFNSGSENIKKALAFSAQHVLLTVAYDNGLLEEGVGISLFLGRKVSPYVNVEALRANGVEMNNLLLRISKIYEGGVN